MLLWYDIVPEQIAQHDEWHTREHFPERVAIPGFIRAQRWVALSGGPRYFVVYEVSDIDVLGSPPYSERLNNPTPWTSRMMPHFRGMTRGFCRLEGSHGTILGTTGVTVRYAAAHGVESQLRSWLDRDLIPGIAGRTGFASVHLLRSDRAPEMTAEQRIRGRDASVDLVLVATGYSPELMKELAASDLSPGAFEAHGASPGTTSGVYQLACLSHAVRSDSSR